MLLGNDAYGGTFRLIAKVWGAPRSAPRARGRAVDLTDVDALAADWPAGTTVVWLETPTNPLLTCVDIEAIAEIAHANGALVVVDNTFATPYLQQPAPLGADVVVHSATKYLGGHSDVVGGFVAVDDDELAERLRFTAERGRRGAGAVRLLPRAARREDARRAHGPSLRQRPRRRRPARRPPAPSSACCYPQLPDHPGHAAAAKQMRDFGGMVSFTVHGGEPAGPARRRRPPSCSRSPSRSAPWRASSSTPAAMTHASAAGSPLEVPDNLVRLSVGIESSADLVADLEQALDTL